jgi:hypothetical protein
VKACGATRHTLHDDDRRLDIDLDLVDLHDQRDIDLRDLQLHDNVHGRRLDIVHVELHFHVRLVLDPGSHLDLHVLVDPGRHLDPTSSSLPVPSTTSTTVPCDPLRVTEII